MSEYGKILVKTLESSNVFLTGGAGVGKSYTIKEVIKFYEKLDKNIAILASTGIAAVHIDGQTLHSFMKFGIAKILPELIDAKLYPHQRKTLKAIISNLDLLIIDEVSMVSAGVMEMIEYRLNQFGFNGRILVVGDFLQLPPVRKKHEESRLMFQYKIEESEALRYFGYAFESQGWTSFSFKKIELNSVKRTSDEDFIRHLHSIRTGSCDEDVKNFINSLIKNRLSKEVAYKSTILYATNKKVNLYNESRLLVSKAQVFDIEAKINILLDSDITQKRVDTYMQNLPIERVLKIKVDAPILFTANTDDFKNGQRGVITSIKNGKKDYKITIKIDTGKEIELERASYELNHYDYIQNRDGSIEVQQKEIAKITQFPIRLAWSLTIHKSQGMSIDNIAISIDEIFEKSQFYVAISRATSVKGLSLLSKKSSEQLDGWIDKMFAIDDKVIDFYLNYSNQSIQKALF